MSTVVLAELPGRACPIAASLELIGERWSLLIIRELALGNRRFSGIVEQTGAPRDRVAARLKALEHAGMVRRAAYQSAPPRFDYHLTAAGKDLLPILRALMAWGDRWVVDEPPVTLLHHDHELVSETVCATCQEPVRNRDVSRRARRANSPA